MYKVASDGRQRALHQGRPTDWVAGEEHLSLRDRFELKKNEDRLIQEKIKNSSGAERKALGLKRQEIAAELRAMRKELGMEHIERQGFEEIFVQICKEQLSPIQYKIISLAARREYDRRQGSSPVPPKERRDA